MEWLRHIVSEYFVGWTILDGNESLFLQIVNEEIANVEVARTLDGMTHDSDKTVDMSVPETQPPPTPVVAAPPPPATVSIKKEDIKEENLMDED